MINGRSILTVTSEINYLPAIQAFARECSKAVGFQDNDQEMILLALEEAVTNVMKHALESAVRSFQIIFEPSIQGIRIIVKDQGLPYDPGLIPDYKKPDDIENIPESGLGSFIMKQCVDEVSFLNLGKDGKELHLVKYCPKRSIIEEREPPPQSQRLSGDDDRLTSSPVFHVRFMDPSEALEVSRLFYRTYGYKYLSEVMYYPDKLVELNRDGLMRSIVAVTGDGEIAGHLAMIRETLDDMIAETGKGAVKQKFRGFDIFTAMQEFLNDQAQDFGIKGLYGRAVTAHMFSQKMTEKTGYKDCALLLGFAPAGIFKGTGVSAQRETCVYSFRAVAELPENSVYLPSHHEPILQRIYANLKLERKFRKSPKNRRLRDLSVLKTRVSSDANSAEVIIEQYGRDCIHVLHNHLVDLCAKKIDHISLLLDLGNPVTGRICKEIEALGFVMAGILPCLHFVDTLILQYLNNLVLDHSAIQLYSPMAKEILRYIENTQ
ncbi:MAG: ATP-binding protein [Syntrophorhabdaceae bacterium]